VPAEPAHLLGDRHQQDVAEGDGLDVRQPDDDQTSLLVRLGSRQALLRLRPP
jgi:hypothetical protein